MNRKRLRNEPRKGPWFRVTVLAFEAWKCLECGKAGQMPDKDGFACGVARRYGDSQNGEWNDGGLKSGRLLWHYRSGPPPSPNFSTT